MYIQLSYFECGNTVVDVSLMQRGIVLVLLALHVHSTAPVSTKGVDRWSVKQVSRRSHRLARGQPSPDVELSSLYGQVTELLSNLGMPEAAQRCCEMRRGPAAPCIPLRQPSHYLGSEHSATRSTRLMQSQGW